MFMESKINQRGGGNRKEQMLVGRPSALRTAGLLPAHSKPGEMSLPLEVLMEHQSGLGGAGLCQGDVIPDQI